MQKLYDNAQTNEIGKYVLFAIDLKNSTDLLKTSIGRRIFQNLNDDLVKFLDQFEGTDYEVIKVQDSGMSHRIIRKGDLLAFIVNECDKDDIETNLNDFIDYLEVFVHSGSCIVETLDATERDEKLFYTDAVIYLEDYMKNKIVNKPEITTGTKSVKLSLDITIEEWLDTEFLTTELQYFLAQYGWDGTIDGGE